MLLDTAVDEAQSRSGQYVGCLLVDQSVKMSLDLQNESERVVLKKKKVDTVRVCIIKQWYLWLMENHY